MSHGFRSGFVAILGRPNAGKSTLLNALVGRKVAIVSDKPQTTRNRIQGILNRQDAQIVLVDTPGIHKPNTVLGRQMMGEVAQAFEGVDIVCLIVDSAESFGPRDRFALAQVSARGGRGPSFLLLNKIDRIPKAKLLPLIDAYSKAHEFKEAIPISARTGDGLPLLLEKLIEHLPEGQPYFPPEQFTDQPEQNGRAHV